MNDFVGKRLEGIWRVKGAPNRKFEGELRIDEGHQGTLVLRGKARHLAAIPERAAVFLGNLTKPSYYAISLLDAGLSRGPSVQGEGNNVSDAEFFTNFIIV